MADEAQEEIKDEEGNASSNIKKEGEDSEGSSDKGKENSQVKSSRGLKVLSVRVRELVYESKTTTYKEVADKLIKELGQDTKTPQSVRIESNLIG